VPEPVKRQEDRGQTKEHLAKANDLLEEMQREETSGYNLKQDADSDKKLSPVSQQPAKQKKAKTPTPENSDGIQDNYEDDFDEIEEDLPQSDVEQEAADDAVKSGNVAGSGHGITASQSLGVDPSVDSLALEDYDHVEPVERLNF